MSKHVFKAPTHGARFDEFSRSPVNPHGALSDDGYDSYPRDSHGPQFDRDFGDRGDAGDAFERALRKVPAAIRSMDAGCPGCGHRHSLEDALRAGRATGKSSDRDVDVMKQVREADEAALGSGADDLHQTLVASIEKTYGIRSRPATVAKTHDRGRGSRSRGAYDEALEIMKRNTANLKT
jgi:hypothetical protein